MQAFRVFALLLMVSVFCLCLNVRLGKSNSSTITVPTDYPTIQEAIDHANAGDTIFVKAGTYTGHISVDKSIVIKGESCQNTLLRLSDPYGEVGLRISASNVAISGFSLTEAVEGGVVELALIDGRGQPRDNVMFTDNILMPKKANTLSVLDSSKAKISNNSVIVDADHSGLVVIESPCCILDGNTIKGGWMGIYCDGSDSTLISNNLVINQISWELSGAITLIGSPNTTVVGNMVANNEKGVYLQRQTGDHIYRNNFINNSQQVILFNVPSVASWDDGYPLGGNYWSDYNGTDVYSGTWQNETGSDGIGDAPYVIGSGNQDNYPLMGPYWNPADVNRDLRIDIKDVVAVSKALGFCPSDLKWNPLCDVNGDLIVDIRDFYIVCKNYGKTYPSNT